MKKQFIKTMYIGNLSNVQYKGFVNRVEDALTKVKNNQSKNMIDAFEQSNVELVDAMTIDNTHSITVQLQEKDLQIQKQVSNLFMISNAFSKSEFAEIAPKAQTVYNILSVVKNLKSESYTARLGAYELVINKLGELPEDVLGSILLTDCFTSFKTAYTELVSLLQGRSEFKAMRKQRLEMARAKSEMAFRGLIDFIDYSCRMFGADDYADFISSYNEIVIESTPNNNSSNSETSTNSEVDPETEEDC
ncbi:MAG: DUF6261 family protein [Bacteroidales bacterium]|nr:DUF6261 family protein [Bacteroidales bacterium]